MSKSIQEALDLPVLEDLLKSSYQEGATDEDDVPSEMVEQEQDEEVHQLSTALSNGAVTEEILEARAIKDHEKAMDDIHDQTIQHAKDLMDLGYNVDTRSAGRIFENAANMFKIALDAKNSKRDAQLKHGKLQVEKRKLELAEKNASGQNDGDTIDGAPVIVEDRNELIKRLRGEMNK